MAGSIKITGGKEAHRALLALSDGKLARKIGRKVLRDAANEIAKSAKARVPVRQGRLKRAIKVRVDLTRGADGLRGSNLSALVYVSDRQGGRARKTDRESTVRGKKGPPKYKYQIGSFPSVYGRFVEYGIRGPVQAFFRPAWDAEGGNTALRRIGINLGAGLEKAAAALGQGRTADAIGEFTGLDVVEGH